MPFHFGAFLLWNSKRNMNNFLHTINGFLIDLYFGDTDSLCFESEHCDKLDRASLVGKLSLQGKNDYSDSVIFLFGIQRWYR